MRSLPFGRFGDKNCQRTGKNIGSNFILGRKQTFKRPLKYLPHCHPELDSGSGYMVSWIPDRARNDNYEGFLLGFSEVSFNC